MINEGASAFRDLLKRLGPLGMAFIGWTIIVVAALTGAPERFLLAHWPQLFSWWLIIGGAWAALAAVFVILSGWQSRYSQLKAEEVEEGFGSSALGLE